MSVPVAGTIAEVRTAVAAARAQGHRVGFVPTMGALHAGHAALVRDAAGRCGFVVASVFVNPTQFGPQEDFARYPRTLDADRQVVADAGGHLVFAPGAEEMYPPGSLTHVDVDWLGDTLCGPRRPGHFRGVATVVLKLLNIVGPDLAVFGAKDAQQARIVRRLVRDLDVPVELLIAPTVREPDGLAMSSRNRYLLPAERAVAGRIYAALRTARERAASEQRVAVLEAGLRADLAAIPGARVDYASIVGDDDLQPLAVLDRPALAAVAVYLGATRLIDNVAVGPPLPAPSPPRRGRGGRSQRAAPGRERGRPMSHPLFGPELRAMLADDDAPGLKAFCDSLHPATAAEALDDFSPAEVWGVISPADIRTQAAIFEYLPAGRQAEMVDGRLRPQVGALIGKMSHDDRADLLRRLPGRVKESLLRLVDEADRRDMATLFTYAENSVGALMTTDYAWLPPTLTAAEAVDQLRQQAPDKETIYYVYILDEPRRKPDGGMAPRPLLGVVSLRDLILAPRQTLLRDLIGGDELVAVKLSDDREVAAETLAQYDFIAVPVLDDSGGMVGIVTHDDVIDVLREEATEDLQKQAAVAPTGAGYAEASLYRLWKSRAQWLAVLFVVELGTFSVMSYFEDAIATVVVLSLFVPLCISVGGNSGTQASTVVTRALALGEIEPADWRRVLGRELLVGVALGLTLGGIALVRGAATPADTRSGPREEKFPFAARVPAGMPLDTNPAGDVVLPAGASLERVQLHPVAVRPPAGATIPAAGPADADGLVAVAFPAGCELRTAPVSRWALGQTIALAVTSICLWGTLVGAMLPLFFARVGMDPAVASGPGVATLVDITGIAIFFSIASALLL